MVIERDGVCVECGFDWARAATACAHDIRTHGVDALEVLSENAPLVRERPEPEIWSLLEYSAHLRDALDFYRERITRTVTEDRPQLHAFDFAGACERFGYNDEEAELTRDGLERAIDAIVATVANLDDDALTRVAIGSNGDERTVLVLTRRAAHEAVHHALDLHRVRDAVAR